MQNFTWIGCRVNAVASAVFTTVLSAVLMGVLSLTLSRPAQSQAASVADRPDAPVCYGFSFSPWKPALDWHASGHAVVLDSALVPRAEGGRPVAAPISEGTDTTLMLFPPWWPVGVAVRFATRAPASGDTVLGRATALVADDRRRQPSISSVRVWRVPCGGRPERPSSYRKPV